MSETKSDAKAAKATKAQPPEEMTVEVTQPVDHDGRRYVPGEALTAAPAAAAALIAAGAAKAG